MRTTLDVNDELLRQAKKRAADQDQTLKAIVEEALRSFLNPQPPPKQYRLRWRSHGGGLMPGVDLRDWDRLRDLVDGVE